MSHNIRLAKKTDAENILEIYAPFILNTAISFETEIPDINTFSNRIEGIVNNYEKIYSLCLVIHANQELK